MAVLFGNQICYHVDRRNMAVHATHVHTRQETVTYQSAGLWDSVSNRWRKNNTHIIKLKSINIIKGRCNYFCEVSWEFSSCAPWGVSTMRLALVYSLWARYVVTCASDEIIRTRLWLASRDLLCVFSVGAVWWDLILCAPYGCGVVRLEFICNLWTRCDNTWVCVHPMGAVW